MNRKRLIRYLLIDIAAASLFVGSFLMYFYVMPRKQTGIEKRLSDENTPLSEERTAPGAGRPEKRGGGNRAPMQDGNTGTSDIPSDQTADTLGEMERSTEQLEAYQDETKQIEITKTTLGTGEDKITYYTAEVSLTSANLLKTAFAENTYGKNIRVSTLEMAIEQHALLAVSGDSYGNSETGVVVRNGILYRDTVNDAEICVLFADGTMKIYTPQEFEREDVLSEAIWQTWNFGPSLLENGEVKDTFQTTSYLNQENPRCALGYLAPGHYKLVLVDGRQSGYSRGATMSELAQIMKEEGCSLAYNLDGGKSSAMVYDGQYVNQPAGGGRDISDIIWIGGED